MFDKDTLEILWYLFWVLVFLASLLFVCCGIPAINKRRDDNLKKAKRGSKVTAELLRISKLPKLDTRWLIPAPDSWNKSDARRAFGNRYNRLVIFDENGKTWVGLFMPETLQSLRDAEYRQGSFWVPFRGDGEMYAMPLVEVEGTEIQIAPLWFDPKNLNTEEWRIWAGFERAFQEAFANQNYQTVFGEILPTDYRIAIERQRDAFERLVQQNIADQPK